MKFRLPIAILAFLAVSIFIFLEKNEKETPPRPLPTNGPKYRTDQLENEGDSNAREAWIELIHKAAPGTDWREEDRLSAKNLAKKRRKNGTARMAEFFADGYLEGEWRERGSKNQAGSMRTVTYVPGTDQIFGVADGGSLWRGNLDGSEWTVLNDNFLLHPEVLESFIPTDSTNVRLVGASGKYILTSDDEGKTWAEATFTPDFYDGWGSPRQLTILPDSAQTMYYLAQTWDADPWAPRQWLYRSTDGGQSFERIHIFQTENPRRLSLWSPRESERVLFFENGQNFYEIQNDTLALLHETTDLPADVNLMLTGNLTDSILTLYTLFDDREVYRSVDGGATWELRGETPDNAWGVGMACSPFNAELLVMGAVNSNVSYDGGETWELVNEWWEYYDDLDMLHADIMDLTFHEKADGAPFLLIANHGGLHVSYDELATTENIGLEGMNIGQYYDVITNPEQTDFIYLGSQDQGWQWVNANGDETSALDFTQQWSGDYGQQQFSRNYQSFWTQYPGGIMDYYHFAFSPPTPWPESEWSLEGEDKPAVGWIVPTAKYAAAPSANAVFIGGGNVDGGPGSHLILLSASTSPPFSIDATQFDFDFKTNSNTGGGLISAIAQSPHDEERLYVATDDGTFFRSTDFGASWEKSPGFSGPTTSWLYTACILPSDIDPETLWLSGSGYDNPPVFKSTDGGMTWEPMSTGLPNTLVQKLAANPDESMLFAATNVGPFVHIEATGEWYPLIGEKTPLQWYTSVEFVDADTIVRFGTFGRGVWDLKISVEPEPPSANGEAVAELGVSVFPNPVPSSGQVNISIESESEYDFSLHTLEGRLVKKMKVKKTGLMELNDLPGAVYFYRLSANGEVVKSGNLTIQ